MTSTPWTLLTAVASIFLPLAAGSYAGGFLRRRLSSNRTYWRWGATVAVLLLPSASAAWVERIGIWDLVATGLLFGAGFIVLLHAPSNRAGYSRLLLATASTGITLLAAESLIAGALKMSPMPPTPVTGFASLDIPMIEPACAAAYSADYGIASRLLGFGERDPRPLVLHLGDSMVYGIGVGGPDGAFPARLDQKDSEHRHINAGFWGSSTDGQWLALKRWVRDHGRAELIVHYVFLGNDFHEIGRPSICCRMQSLVVYGETAQPRCDTARYEVPLRERLEVSPAPFALRAVAHRSAFASQLVDGFAHLGAALVRWGVGGGRYYILHGFDRNNFRHFAMIEEAVRAEAESAGAKLLVVLLVPRQLVSVAIGRKPVGMDLWEGKGEDARARVLATLREGGYDVIDTFDFVKALVEDPEREAWFAGDFPGDFHFSARGHERFAEWLRPQLSSRLQAESN